MSEETRRFPWFSASIGIIAVIAVVFLAFSESKLFDDTRYGCVTSCIIDDLQKHQGML